MYVLIYILYMLNLTVRLPKPLKRGFKLLFILLQSAYFRCLQYTLVNIFSEPIKYVHII